LAVKEKNTSLPPARRPMFREPLNIHFCCKRLQSPRPTLDLKNRPVHKLFLGKRLCGFWLVRKIENLKNLSKLSRQHTVVRRRQQAKRLFLPYFLDEEDGSGSL